jgi:hypothetical protein
MNNTKRLCLVLLTIVPLQVWPQASLITSRIQKSLISQSINDDVVDGFLKTLNPDGSWPDINYDDRSITNWNPVTHSDRLLSITIAWNKPQSKFFHETEVLDKISAILNFYIRKKPESDNWWFNAIGAPLKLGPALVMLKTTGDHGIDQALLKYYAETLLLYYKESVKKWPFSGTGANKIWLLNSSINKACVLDNDDVLAENFSLAFGEASVMPGTKEGIKIDFSFWQHGPQLYCAGYGMSFLNEITNYGALAHNSEFSMTAAQLLTLTNSVLDGYRWFCQNDAFDYGSAGREISRRGAVSSSGLKRCIERLIEMDAPRSTELKSFIKFIDGEELFPDQGNRHFWKSDIMVQHGPDYYISARMPSIRMNATEKMNNENLKSWWLPWGAMSLMTQGDEYRNLFPVWDWSKIPGVTSYMEDLELFPASTGSYLNSQAMFAGGVSNGSSGFAAYDFSWDSVSARKAWFFTPDAVLCLGAGINGEKEKKVITSLNQCFSCGDIMVSNGKKISTFKGDDLQTSDLKWVYHDRFGYLFPGGGNINLMDTEQTGAWSDINKSQPAERLTHKVFSLWVDHGIQPLDEKYEYIIVPCKDVESMSKWVKNNRLKTISNTASMQCVQDARSGIYGISFYLPESISLGDLTVSANYPCLLLLDCGDKSKIRVTVSDPTQVLWDIRLKFSRKLSGNNVIINSEGTSTIKIILPQGDEAGKSATFEYSISQ